MEANYFRLGYPIIQNDKITLITGKLLDDGLQGCADIKFNKYWLDLFKFREIKGETNQKKFIGLTNFRINYIISCDEYHLGLRIFSARDKLHIPILTLSKFLNLFAEFGGGFLKLEAIIDQLQKAYEAGKIESIENN